MVINQQFVYLFDTPDSFQKAEELFRSNENVLNIPVVSHDKRLLYEYVKDYEKFYDELNIECGINKQDKRGKRIVISLTTHGKRLDTVYLTIKSINVMMPGSR